MDEVRTLAAIDGEELDHRREIGERAAESATHADRNDAEALRLDRRSMRDHPRRHHHVIAGIPRRTRQRHPVRDEEEVLGGEEEEGFGHLITVYDHGRSLGAVCSAKAVVRRSALAP